MRILIRRRRLRLAMNAAQYRHQQFRRVMAVFISFCCLALVALVCCSSMAMREQRRAESSLGPDEPYPVGMSMETWLKKLGVEVLPAVPKATNRDSRGRFITPPCPICGAEATLVCTTWRCENGHRYESPDDDLTD